ncbi:MAG: caspase family protein [Paracoccaceae bacterium]
MTFELAADKLSLMIGALRIGWVSVWLTMCIAPAFAQQTQEQAFQRLAEYVVSQFYGLQESLVPTPSAGPGCDYSAPGRTHAIVMGAADAGTMKPRMLGGSENSAALVEATLTHIGVAPDRISTLTGQQATRDGLTKALTTLRQNVNCTDTVFLYLTAVMTSTRLLTQQLYGSDEPRDWIEEGADTNATLRAISAASPFILFNITDDRPNDLLSAQALTDIVTDLRNRSAHVTLVLDTAFAGLFDLQERQARRDPRALWSASLSETLPQIMLNSGAGAFSLHYTADAFSYAAQWQLPKGAPDARVYSVFAYKLAAALYADEAPTTASIAREIKKLRFGERTAEYENHQIESTDPGAPIFAELGVVFPAPPEPAPEQPPLTDVIRILSPTPSRSAAPLDTPVLEIKGQVVWPEQTMIVLVDRAQALSRPDGTFSHEIELEPGLNSIEIVALTRDNQQHRKVLEFTFEGDAQALTGTGQRYAILIANQNYGASSGMPSLTTPFADIDAIGEELTGRFGFRTEADLPDGGLLPLVLRDASRSEIETLLFRMSQIAGEKDTVLIYYGGHGIYEQMTDTAFWVPSDAVAGVPPTYLSASSISEALLRLQAGNVLVVSDSCYSGALMRAAPTDGPGADEDRLRALQRLADKRSRVLITSGANEPVADQGGDGHSVFARAFLNGLRQSERDVFSARELFDRDILPFVVGRSGQEPQYRPIARSGHEGGDVVFVAQGG